LRNVRIGDVNILLEILESIGVKTDRPRDHEITIRAEAVRSTNLPVDLCRKIRASILLSAPLLIRCGHAEIPLPGGDRIGRRRIDTHLLGFEALGAKYELTDDVYKIWCGGRLKGRTFYWTRPASPRPKTW